ncbi:glyoxalase [Flavobacterium rivuli WB 3.3-2 = DSM 21788]|uniref:Glyoxalase n=1 Tax=Flavobacterium rivuli WB 3.3-2 = DSM 21788 TaxID=1121895 RepID=A0A0A2M710_9FLAO|nr:VOC family protein [Flavobacterium rivuli]KGO88447.1 glyoxalase [Flavobacterium rivuli WB 3.3-2 = DSM 21788]
MKTIKNRSARNILVTPAIAFLSVVLFLTLSEKASAQNGAGIQGVEHVGINVPDLEKGVAFFTDVLGFTPVTQIGPLPLDAGWKQANHVNPGTGAVTIKMFSAGTGANIEIICYADSKGNKVQPNTDDVGATHIAFYTTDIYAAVKYLKAKGVKIIGEPYVTQGGDTVGETWVYFETPWGSKLELVSYPNGKGYEKINPKVILWSPKDAAENTSFSSKNEVENLSINKALVQRHLEIWNEKDQDTRTAAMAKIYAKNIEMVDRSFIATGNDEISKFVEEVQKKNPDFKFMAKSVEGHHNIIRLYWQFGPVSKPATITGMDIFVLENGKVKKMYVFVDDVK